MGIPKQEIILDKYDYDYIEDCLSEDIQHEDYYRLPILEAPFIETDLKPPTRSI